jgi:hypothetical protein
LAKIEFHMESTGFQNIVLINIFVFCLYILWFRSLKLVTQYLDQKNGECRNYSLKIFGKTIWILQKKSEVTKVLNKSSESSLTFANKTFFHSHGHYYGIGNLDIGDETSLWHIVHQTLLKAAQQENHKLSQLMNAHLDILTYKYNYHYCINKILKEYVLTIWGKFCFGDDIDIEKYTKMRDLTIGTLRKTFYDHYTNLIPGLGAVICKLKYWLHRRKFMRIDRILLELILKEGNKGFMHKFMHELCESIKDPKLVLQIVLDNAFLSTLVYDFIYIFVLEAIVKISRDKVDDYEQRMKRKNEFLGNAFLFENRLRYINHTNGPMKPGDYAIVNLVKTELYFSYGPRACIGVGTANKFYEHLFRILDKYIILSDDNHKIEYNSNPNVPEIISEHNIKLQMKSHFLKEVIPCYEHNGIQQFYRIDAIPENVELYQYIIFAMCEQIKEMRKHVQIDAIVAPEARGYIFAGAIADRLKIPYFLIRKKGKIAGSVHEQTYQKKYPKTMKLNVFKFQNMQI